MNIKLFTILALLQTASARPSDYGEVGYANGNAIGYAVVPTLPVTPKKHWWSPFKAVASMGMSAIPMVKEIIGNLVSEAKQRIGWGAVSPSDTRIDEFSGSGGHDFGNVGVLPHVDIDHRLVSGDPSVSVYQYDNYDSSESDANCPSCPDEYVNDNGHFDDVPTELINEQESKASTRKSSRFDVRKLDAYKNDKEGYVRPSWKN